MASSLELVDWLIIAGYLGLALAVGFLVKGKAQEGKESYFLAGRSLPWWWAGMSIAATTFAADTPLVITGIVASDGLSGNWIWLSWMGVHAAAAVFFAAGWSRSGVVTDAELIALRYSGRQAEWLRSFRAGLYGILYNCVILGWVLTAMVKIASPFFRWREWFPGPMGALEAIWPAHSALGSAEQGVTVLVLLALVGIYSSMGGIRGVVLTDMFQLAMALLGSAWFAYLAWDAVGGTAGVQTSLVELYGTDHGMLDWLPSGGGMGGAAGLGFFAFGAYLIVQSYANVPADGGGYFMQRLNAARSPSDARGAAMLFIALQYIVRVWPWLLVAVAAVVLFPEGNEQAVFGEAGAVVAADRESAYPVLMGLLLPTGVLGLMVASLLAAFMSTIDTHLNWGASYVVNDLYGKRRPDASQKQQVRVARLTVLGFVVAGVLVSFQIQSIEQAWKLVAALGASFGIPTVLRWFWWRVNAAAELGAALVGLTTAVTLGLFVEYAYEIELVMISGASALGMASGMIFGPRTAPETLERFVERVEPRGIWPGAPVGPALRDLGRAGSYWLVALGAVVMGLIGGQRLFFFGEHVIGIAAIGVAIAALVWVARRRA